MDSSLTGHATPQITEQLAVLEQELKIHPEDVNLLVEYGALLFEPFHRTEEARHVLKRAAALDPQDARSLFWLAKLAWHRDLDDAEALRLIERALAVSPHQPESLSLYISLLRCLPGEVDRCRAHASLLTDLAPDWPRAHQLRAQVALDRGDLAEARFELNRAFELARELRGATRVPQSYFEEVVTGRYVTPSALRDLEEELTRVRRQGDGDVGV